MALNLLLWTVAAVAVLLFAVYLWVRSKQATARPVGPQPPMVSGGWPIVGRGIEFVKNPRVFLNQCREKYGDEFLLNVFGFKMFFVFSDAGLKEFYKFSERDASFAEATRVFLGFKVPPEVLQGEMSVVLRVLKGRQRYLALFYKTMEQEIERLGPSGTFEVFAFMKGVVHKIGFTTWIGAEALDEEYYSRLITDFIQIDPEAVFTGGSNVVTTLLTGQKHERAAIKDIAVVIKEILHRRMATGEEQHDMMEAFHDEFAHISDEDERFSKVASQIMVLHMASQSNLFAAIAWTLIDLLQNAEALEEIKATNHLLREEYGEGYLQKAACLDKMAFLEGCFNESIRLAQQSLTLRKVVNPIIFESSGRTVVPGYYIATLLSCLNKEEAILPDAGTYDPKRHYDKGKLQGAREGADASISAFGHGVHACPGRRFATHGMKIVLSLLLERLDMQPKGGFPASIVDTSMGAVGRSDAPVNVAYTQK